MEFPTVHPLLITPTQVRRRTKPPRPHTLTFHQYIDELDCPTKEIPTEKPEVNAYKVDDILVIILSSCLLSALVIALGIYSFIKHNQRYGSKWNL